MLPKIALSLDASTNEEGSPFIEQVADQTSLEAFDFCDDNIRAIIAEGLTHLLPKEAEVIKQRFGLTGMDSKTLKEIGKDYKLSRERVRQIEVKALRKLKKFISNIATQSPEYKSAGINLFEL
jgi:RNA polymerase sigma factor (sigma-70 family)